MQVANRDVPFWQLLDYIFYLTLKNRYINICKQRPGLLHPKYGFAKNINISIFNYKNFKSCQKGTSPLADSIILL